VAAGRAELDSFDIVEGLFLVGGLRLEVLNVVSLLGGWPGAWPQPLVTAKTAVAALVAHWREFGRPAYAQFDNDTIFQGAHQHRDSISRVMRTCLRLDVTPVFAPPRERGSRPPSKTSTAAGELRFGLASTMIRSPPSTSVPGAISARTANAPPPAARRLPRDVRSRLSGSRICKRSRAEW